MLMVSRFGRRLKNVLTSHARDARCLLKELV
jgi:hypothetical protein